MTYQVKQSKKKDRAAGCRQSCLLLFICCQEILLSLQILATPLSIAACATAFATAGPTFGSKA